MRIGRRPVQLSVSDIQISDTLAYESTCDVNHLVSSYFSLVSPGVSSRQST